MKLLRKILFPLIWLKERISPDYWANRIGEESGLYDKARVYGEKKKPWYIKLALILVIIVLFFFMAEIQAGDNHVHIEQVSNGDDTTVNILQKGDDNEIRFSFDHRGNEFNLEQNGSGNTISWVPYWGSGKSWGGDIDGINNTLNIEQHDGATYGGHVWGDSNEVDVYQHGTHTHYLDIHVDSVDHDLWQEGSGSHYSHIYYYGTSDSSIANVQQKGSGNHTATITLQGTQPTTLNLIQDSATNQSYSLTQTCYTVGGCSITVTQD